MGEGGQSLKWWWWRCCYSVWGLCTSQVIRMHAVHLHSPLGCTPSSLADVLLQSYLHLLKLY